MQHRLRFIPDDMMPCGKDWVMYRSEEATLCYVRDSLRQRPAALERVLDEAWDGFCALAECDREEPKAIPPQRSSVYL